MKIRRSNKKSQKIKDRRKSKLKQKNEKLKERKQSKKKAILEKMKLDKFLVIYSSNKNFMSWFKVMVGCSLS